VPKEFTSREILIYICKAALRQKFW